MDFGQRSRGTGRSRKRSSSFWYNRNLDYLAAYRWPGWRCSCNRRYKCFEDFANDFMEAMKKDSGVELNSLKVDGGMVANELLMPFQADLLNVPVIRPAITETTAFGAAYAAGLAVDFWSSETELRKYWSEERIWQPNMDNDFRRSGIRGWKKTVQRTFNWVD